MLDTLLSDLRTAGRTVLRAPGFVALVTGILAIVMTAAATLFTIANALLIRPPAGEDPARLVRLFYATGANINYPDVIEFRDASRTLDLAAFDDQRVAIRDGGETQGAYAELLTSNYFTLTGIQPARGRVFTASDDAGGPAAVAVISDAYWRRHFRSDPAVVGRSIVVNGVDVLIVGVAPPTFAGAFGLMAADLWLPFSLDPLLTPGSQALDRRVPRGMQVLGRLRPGVTLAQAQADAQNTAAQLQQRFPQETPLGVSVQQAALLPADAANAATALLGVLLGIAIVLLLAACTNVANLLLARGVAMRRDMTLRQALGASRWRLVRQQLTESLVMAILATTLGLAAAGILTRALMQLDIPSPIPLALDLTLDWRVLAFAAVLGALTTLVCGLAPALHGTRGQLVSTLKDSGNTITVKSRARSTFVVAQVASSVILLIVAGLFVRSLVNASAVNVGMEIDRVLFASLDTQARYASDPQREQFYQLVRRQTGQLPGVAAASFAATVPLTLNSSAVAMRGPDRGTAAMDVRYNIVSPGHFATLAIPLLQGRDFDDRDAAAGTGVIIVNEALAGHWFGTQSPIGRVVYPSEATAAGLQVIGVARNARYAGVGEDQQLFAYFAMSQRPVTAPSLLVRSTGDPRALITAVRGAVASIDGQVPVFTIDTLASAAEVALLPARFAALVSGVLAAVVLILATLGIYGVMSFVVRQRAREIGIRISLGANPANVTRLIMRQPFVLTTIGIVIGVAVSAAATLVLSGLLFNTSAFDPFTFIGAIALVILVSVVSSLTPLRRATHIAPASALRADS